MAQLPPELVALLARLTPEQQATFLIVLEKARDEESFNRELQRHPDILKVMQAAVQTDNPGDGSSDLKAIPQEIDRLQSLQEMPYRIELCRQALAAVHREENAELWANLHNEMANSLGQSPQGSRAENLEEAIAHFNRALEVYRLQQFPANFQQTHRNLGHQHFGEGAWTAALAAYQEAIRAGQVLLGGAYTEAGRQAEVAETATLYTRSAYASLKLGRVGEALVQLEQGKTRLLSHALALAEANVNTLPGPEQDLLRRFRQTLRALETEMRLPADTPPGATSACWLKRSIRSGRSCTTPLSASVRPTQISCRRG